MQYIKYHIYFTPNRVIKYCYLYANWITWIFTDVKMILKIDFITSMYKFLSIMLFRRLFESWHDENSFEKMLFLNKNVCIFKKKVFNSYAYFVIHTSICIFIWLINMEFFICIFHFMWYSKLIPLIRKGSQYKLVHVFWI